MGERTFKTPQDNSKLWLRKHFHQEKFRWALVLLLNFLGLGFSLIQPFPLKLLADSVFGHQPAFWPLEAISSTSTLLYIAAGATFFIAILTGVYSLASGLLQQRIEMRLNLAVQRELLDAVLSTPAASRERLNSGEYQYRLNNLAYAVSDLFYTTYVTIARSLVFIIAMAVVLVLINAWLALLALAVMPLIYLNVRRFAVKFQRQSKDLTTQENKVYDLLGDTVTHQKLIQESSSEEDALKLFASNTIVRNRLSIRYALTTTFFQTLNDNLTNLATAALIIVGGAFVFSGKISFGDLLVFITYMGMLYSPLQEMSSALSTYQEDTVQIGFLYQIIDTATRLKITGGPQTEGIGTDVAYKGITLSFGNKLVLNDVSLVVPTGKKLAIIGPSGVGKSTLLDILPRFTLPQRGVTTLGGVDIREWDLHALRNHIAILDQTPQIFNDTVIANILYGTGRNASETILPEVIKVAIAANAFKFVEDLPLKFDTALGSNGVTLSIGQAQRICLARALMKNAPILLLDEPTSALDEGSRREVIEAIKLGMRGKTVMLVTHDYELLSAVDYIVALKDGKLLPITTNDELRSFIAYLDTQAKAPEKLGNLSLQKL